MRLKSGFEEWFDAQRTKYHADELLVFLCVLTTSASTQRWKKYSEHLLRLS